MSLQVQHITKSYGDNRVLKDVSLELKKGDIKVLMGTNGSGKTTLLNIITGFLKPDNGDVLLYNKSINMLRPYQRNLKGIGRTFQDMRLIGELTVIDNILLAFRKQLGERWWKIILPSDVIDKEQIANKIKAIDTLKQCFIDDVMDNKASDISYGQQKLLNLACCMVNNADVLLLDEPVAGVNPVYQGKLEQAIKTLKKNKAILIIEHNANFIEGVADEILFLNDGKITTFADYTSMQNNNIVQEAYI